MRKSWNDTGRRSGEGEPGAERRDTAGEVICQRDRDVQRGRGGTRVGHEEPEDRATDVDVRDEGRFALLEFEERGASLRDAKSVPAAVVRPGSAAVRGCCSTDGAGREEGEGVVDSSG